MTDYSLVVIDVDRARAWIRGSLVQGSDIAVVVSRHLSRFAGGLLMLAGPIEQEAPALDDVGRNGATDQADLAAATLLRLLAKEGGKTLVVEDDTGRSGDANLGDHVIIIGDRVARWADIRDGVDRAVCLLRRGSSGYPLNAYVLAQDSQGLGLTPSRRSLADATCAERIIDELQCVISSAHDAEAYAALVTSAVAAALPK